MNLYGDAIFLSRAHWSECKWLDGSRADCSGVDGQPWGMKVKGNGERTTEVMHHGKKRSRAKGRKELGAK